MCDTAAMSGSTLLGPVAAVPCEIDPSNDRSTVVVDADHLAEATGWALKPEGFCAGDHCVPVRDGATVAAADGALHLRAVADVLGARLVIDAERMVAALSVAQPLRATTRTGHAEPFTLPDLDGVVHPLEAWAGKKKLLVCWASW